MTPSSSMMRHLAPNCPQNDNLKTTISSMAAQCYPGVEQAQSAEEERRANWPNRLCVVTASTKMLAPHVDSRPKSNNRTMLACYDNVRTHKKTEDFFSYFFTDQGANHGEPRQKWAQPLEAGSLRRRRRREQDQWSSHWSFGNSSACRV